MGTQWTQWTQWTLFPCWASRMGTAVSAIRWAFQTSRNRSGARTESRTRSSGPSPLRTGAGPKSSSRWFGREAAGPSEFRTGSASVSACHTSSHRNRTPSSTRPNRPKSGTDGQIDTLAVQKTRTTRRLRLWIWEHWRDRPSERRAGPGRRPERPRSPFCTRTRSSCSRSRQSSSPHRNAPRTFSGRRRFASVVRAGRTSSSSGTCRSSIPVPAADRLLPSSWLCRYRVVALCFRTKTPSRQRTDFLSDFYEIAKSILNSARKSTSLDIMHSFHFSHVFLHVPRTCIVCYHLLEQQKMDVKSYFPKKKSHPT